VTDVISLDAARRARSCSAPTFPGIAASDEFFVLLDLYCHARNCLDARDVDKAERALDHVDRFVSLLPPRAALAKAVEEVRAEMAARLREEFRDLKAAIVTRRSIFAAPSDKPSDTE
jgi:hypothetical protein